MVAISPILLYIGMLIGAQAFQETPTQPRARDRAGAGAASCGLVQDADGRRLGAAGTNAAAIGVEKFGQVGVLYHGLEVLGGGAILSGLVLGAIGVFMIEKKFAEAAAFAAAGAVLTFFGFMHGELVGFAVTPSVAVAYAIVAAFLYSLSQRPRKRRCRRRWKKPLQPHPLNDVSVRHGRFNGHPRLHTRQSLGCPARKGRAWRYFCRIV